MTGEFGPCGIVTCSSDSLLKLNGVPVCFPHFEEALAGVREVITQAQEELT